MIDSHSHLYLEEFDNDRSDAIRRAKDAGIRHIVLPNVDFDSFAAMHSLHIDFPDYTSMAIGLHPTSVTNHNDAFLEQIDNLLSTNHITHNYVAIGEVGMDLYWSSEYFLQQRHVLFTQIEFALKYHLPMIIHCRNALDQILDVFDYFKSSHLPEMVFHSFTGTAEDVKRIREYGDIYFGINGIVTFKKSNLDETIREIGLDRILLETDCPYLAPVPHRGKRNESAYIPFICNRIAQAFDMSPQIVDSTTDVNAIRLFSLPL